MRCHHARVAQHNFEQAGVANQTEIRIGSASESLRQMAAANEPLFDLIFIDADKDGYPEYLRLCLPLLRDEGLLLGDNTLLVAVLTDEASGTKQCNAEVAKCLDLTSIIIPILRNHGLDGLTVSVKHGKRLSGKIQGYFHLSFIIDRYIS
jgi:predicted O-methyltransferase YrrM